jgi:phytoene dehydrogenase-like protein
MADVIVVGAGHNGLICAAYLARAGLDTLLVEARPEVGGCASTVSDLGARFNICNCDHTMVRAMPVIDELELAGHGLRYLEAGAAFVNVFRDGTAPWASFHDQERQLDALARTHPGQVDGYRRYLDDALPVAALIVEIARAGVGTPRMLAAVARRRAAGARRLLEWSRRSATEVLGRYFDDWHLVMPAVSTGPTVWGVHPDAPGTGLAAAGYATRHLVRTGRPEGGSGALTDAVLASFVNAGGQLRCGERVDALLVGDGSVTGVRLADGSELAARAVVAACDPQRVFVDWVGEAPPAARRLVDRWRELPTHDGYESKVDAVLSDLPAYRFASEMSDAAGVDVLESTLVVSPDPDQLAEAHAGLAEGAVAAAPTMLSNIPSVLDPTMRTAAGEHVLSLEVLFTPYALRDGWQGSDEPDRWLDLWADFAEPGARDLVSRYRAMTPDRYEQEFSMHRGHAPAYAAPPLAALLGRRRELTRYRTPIAGLYLSGAATFPGAGIFGASGRNTAEAVRWDVHGVVGRRVSRARHGVLGLVGAVRS